MSKNWVFNVGINAYDERRLEQLADVLRESFFEYDFVTDVMDWREGDEEETTDIDRKKA